MSLCIQEIGNAADSNYYSLSLKLPRRLASGLTYLAAYNFWRSIDGSGIRTLGSVAYSRRTATASTASAA